MTFRELVRAHLDGKASGHAVARALVQADTTWHLPATLGTHGPSPWLRASEAGPWLVAFSQSEELAAWAAARELGPLSLEVDGPGLVQMLSEDLAGLELEQGTPEAIHYQAAQLDTLREWAEAVAVESIFRGVDLPDPWRRVREYPAYRILMQEGGKARMVLAPDRRGRRLAAVCTAPDTLDAFETQVREQLGLKVRSLRLGGQELFTMLQAMPLDGIVFNPSGPVPASALAPALCTLVLTG